MKLVTKIVLAALATVAGASAAPAATYLTIGGASGIFGNSFVGCTASQSAPCDFTTTFTFDGPAGYLTARADISSGAASNVTTEISNLDLKSVTLNGSAFELDPSGQFEYGYLLTTALLAKDNMLVVTGKTYGQAAFAGSLAFAQAPVPEPATWAMMIVGFGLIGGAMRSARGKRLSTISA